ncbi:TrkA family potassium uptake protein [Faecalicatena contorta]|uniref:potassium channel family protein n=1 Tax=Faecalicatena contorta TaxID=39482 RepID=UPI001F35B34B|nr:TrkA family potassium uptake protein [Faecalicatena contorta]MCF2679194.1 TrkA family potassium uptake protein [Faecalicatena contorta]
MKKQFAVLGVGSFGESVAVELQNLGCEVIAVDNDMERIEEIADSVSYAMRADFGEPEVIRSLGARNLDGVVVAVAENMESSIMATLVSKEIGVPYVMAKAKTDLHATVLRKIGADAVIFPEVDMGKRIAKTLASANFADWLSLSPDFSIVEIKIPEKWVGKSLIELDVRRVHAVNVVAIKTGDDVEVNPDPARKLEEGMIMVLVGANEALEKI